MRIPALAALLAAALLPGCVAFTVRHDWGTGVRQPCEPRFFAGTVQGAAAVGQGLTFPFWEDGSWVDLVAAPFFLLDLPFSFVTDLGYLPSDARVNAPRRKPRPLPPAEAQAVDRCLAHVRDCQLADGAFAVGRPRADPGARVWVAPYFGQFAALALLAGHARQPNPEDLARVRRWLDWCAAHQTADGVWHDFEGTSAAIADTGRVDAWDSSAALYLLAAERFRREGGLTSIEIFAAARHALACLASLADAGGLAWAKPDYRVSFLMDNIEAAAGLRAAARLFGEAHYADEARQARALAGRLARELPAFYQPDRGLFAYARHADGTLVGGLDKPYPHGLAQLYGVAFVAPDAPAWEAACRAFRPEDGPSAACGAEWWLVAASRLDAAENRTWRNRVVAATAAFSPDRTYLHRYALSALALLEGASWLTAEEKPHANPAAAAPAAAARAAGAR